MGSGCGGPTMGVGGNMAGPGGMGSTMGGGDGSGGQYGQNAAFNAAAMVAAATATATATAVALRPDRPDVQGQYNGQVSSFNIYSFFYFLG